MALDPGSFRDPDSRVFIAGDFSARLSAVSVTTGVDPATNNWNLGPDAPTPPTVLTNEGYGTAISWNLNDLYNQGVNAESFLYSPEFSPRDKTLMMLFKRLREIDVPEMMASIIVETKGKPWGYYDPAAWKSVVDYMVATGQMEKPLDPTNLYTNDLLEEINAPASPPSR